MSIPMPGAEPTPPPSSPEMAAVALWLGLTVVFFGAYILYSRKTNKEEV